MLFLLIGCVTPLTIERRPQPTVPIEGQPRNINNICTIFFDKPHWVKGVRASYEKWNLPVELMMAIIRHESSFLATARPLDARGRRQSSAYGYAQALDGTWRQYQQETKRTRDRRDDFADAVYFVGWYAAKAIDVHDALSPYDVTGLYVLYHDGWASLQEGREAPRVEVLETATKVYKRTLNYHQQLKECPSITSRLYSERSNKNDVRWF